MAGKRTRRTRAELRDMMIAAGRDVLFRIEPSLGFEELTYSTVFEHLQANYDQKVTIGSVHERIWKSQRDFQLDVVGEVLREPIDPISNSALTRAVEAMSEFDLSTPKMRRYAIQTANRLSSMQLFEEPMEREVKLAHTVRFRLWSLEARHPEADAFAHAINEIRVASTEAYSNVVRSIMDVVGLRVRSDAGDPQQAIEDIALLGNAVSLGLHTDVLAQSKTIRELPTGLDGEVEEWYPDALALWCFVRGMLELDGDDLTAAERRL